jgi:hypothetical protein
MSSILNAVLAMTADVYRQQTIQDEDTGHMQKTWTYYKTINCHAKGVITNSTTRKSDAQVFGNTYENIQLLEIRSNSKLTIKEKITNIKDKDGNFIWTELNAPYDSPTVFEVIGTTPITDPFGTTLAFNSTIKRSENQVIGE